MLPSTHSNTRSCLPSSVAPRHRSRPRSKASAASSPSTDGTGRILAVRGDKETLHRARDANMAPWSCWSEWATGTNGMGTALEAPGAVLISGPEHWCLGFHDWVCAGVAVRDAVTREPVAVLDVSSWARQSPDPGRDLAVQGSRRGTRDPAAACPRQRRRAGRGFHPDTSALGQASPPWTRAARS